MNMLNSGHFLLTYIEIMFKDNLRPGCICCRLNLILGQNDFNVGNALYFLCLCL